MEKRLFIIFMLISTTSFAYSQNQIAGKWLSEDKEGITEIYQQNGQYFGKITWLRKPNDSKNIPFTDTENPDISLRKRALIGLIILKDLKYENNAWKDGTIYDPESGKTYTCNLWMADKNTLKVRAYLGIFYETQTWTKTN